jgi:hypothetical protein
MKCELYIELLWERNNNNKGGKKQCADTHIHNAMRDDEKGCFFLDLYFGLTS